MKKLRFIRNMQFCGVENSITKAEIFCRKIVKHDQNMSKVPV